MKKLKFKITIKNDDPWPRIDRDGYPIGNYAEWADAEYQDDKGNWHTLEEGDPLEDAINMHLVRMHKGSYLNSFQSGETDEVIIRVYEDEEIFERYKKEKMKKIDGEEYMTNDQLAHSLGISRSHLQRVLKRYKS